MPYPYICNADGPSADLNPICHFADANHSCPRAFCTTLFSFKPLAFVLAIPTGRSTYLWSVTQSFSVARAQAQAVSASWSETQ
jgi:hypothetical protein